MHVARSRISGVLRSTGLMPNMRLSPSFDFVAIRCWIVESLQSMNQIITGLPPTWFKSRSVTSRIESTTTGCVRRLIVSDSFIRSGSCLCTFRMTAPNSRRSTSVIVSASTFP